jgi:hypothetical protein
MTGPNEPRSAVYRRRAAELHTIADHCIGRKDYQEQLHRIADGWEEMAVTSEASDKRLVGLDELLTMTEKHKE